MTPVVGLLRTQLPACVRKMALDRVFRATAEALGCPAPQLAGLTADACLLRYGQFTGDRVAELLRDGEDLAAIEERLYGNGYALGKTCRRLSHINTVKGAMSLGRVLYRVLDIEFQGDEDGIVIDRCYLSRFYTSQVCEVMSAMDRGLIAGLSDGRQLAFFARITEGQPQCRAQWNSQGGRRR